MRCTDLPLGIQKILTEVVYVALATVCPDGAPWNTPVRGYFDDRLNLYWASSPTSQHSRNIAQNADIFVVIYRSNAQEGEGLGLYLEMTARRLTYLTEIASARQIYTTDFGEDYSHKPFTGSCPRRLYIAKPHRFWYNSEAYIKGNFVDVRREIKI